MQTTPTIILLYIVITIFYSCKSNTIGHQSTVAQAVNEAESQKIISIIINIDKPSPISLDSASLYELTISDGFLKKDIVPAPTHAPGKWMVSFLNERQQAIKNTLVNDPLLRDFEYIEGEPGQLQFAHKEVQLKASSFAVRARYAPEMKFILLEKADSLGNPMISKFFEIHH